MGASTREFWIQEHRIFLDPDPRYCPTSFSLLLANAIRVPQGSVVADVGCGGGVQSIVSAKLGAKRVIAIDLRSECLSVCEDAARANRVSSIVRVLTGNMLDQIRDKSLDVIVSNPPTMPKSPLTPRYTWGGEKSPTEMLERLINEAARTLRSGGSLQMIASTIISGRWIASHVRKVGLTMRVTQQHILPLRKFYYEVYTESELQELKASGSLVGDSYGDLFETLSVIECIKK